MVFKTLLVLLAIFPTFAKADEFEELNKKQVQLQKNNPFADRKAFCTGRTEKGMKFIESWSFYAGTHQFERKLDVGISIFGKYESTDKLLTIYISEKKHELKYKLTANGFQYIWHPNEKTEKILFACIWTST